MMQPIPTSTWPLLACVGIRPDSWRPGTVLAPPSHSEGLGRPASPGADVPGSVRKVIQLCHLLRSVHFAPGGHCPQRLLQARFGRLHEPYAGAQQLPVSL